MHNGLRDLFRGVNPRVFFGAVFAAALSFGGGALRAENMSAPVAPPPTYSLDASHPDLQVATDFV